LLDSRGIYKEKKASTTAFIFHRKNQTILNPK
jgi:hypothetical protein